MIIGGSESGKINFLFNLINKEPYIDQVYSYAEDLYETKYQFLINKRESTGLKHFNNSQAFIQCSNYINAIYKNHLRIESKLEILVIFYDMVTDILLIKNLIQ